MMKILKRNKIIPRYLGAGDTLVVTWIDREGNADELAKTSLDATQAMTVDEAILFETEFENRRALGGMVVEQVKP